jgi:alpha,alpha-trehalase
MLFVIFLFHYRFAVTPSEFRSTFVLEIFTIFEFSCLWHFTNYILAQVLQTMNLAQLFADPKTIVDKPTSKSSQQVLSAFNALGNNASEGAVEDFVETNFRGEGLELEALALPQFKASPKFLNNVSDPVLRAWSQTVHGYWTQLARGTNESALCPEGTQSGPCESSLIPLNHTFVVPGGRFREQCTFFI